jgi:hypothetical protein
MKSRSALITGAALAAIFAFTSASAQTASPAPAVRSAPETRAVETNPVPRSVFVVPTNSVEGRDPFFPNRLAGASSTKHPVSKIPPLILNGISGTPEHRLVMINGRTMAEGEEPEVPTSAGRVRVRCIKIKADSVLVEVNGEPQELRLRD